MIRSFRHKGLRDLWETDSQAAVDARMVARLKRKLAALHAAIAPQDMDLPGFKFHALRGDRAGTYTVHVNGPWCITFQWGDGHATDVDLENYH